MGDNTKPKGFKGWIDLFKSGTQTDSQGRTQDFSHDDLDSIIKNHDAGDPAPIVVGHPKAHAPAFGWTFALRRDGDVLQGKFVDVVPEFEEAVKERRYRKRSISIEPDGNGGFKLNTWAFLALSLLPSLALKISIFPVEMRRCTLSRAYRTPLSLPVAAVLAGHWMP
ncbi:phage protein [Vibrio variabilis]|uniref:Phage protein n=1 Tax=Vibrio variabilis TaxID=990271 RepID=A0ABQ0JLQ5_9VIBR|nr:phage protein [Vibrio variabilis]